MIDYMLSSIELEKYLDQKAELDFYIDFGVDLTEEEWGKYCWIKYLLGKHNDACETHKRLYGW